MLKLRAYGETDFVTGLRAVAALMVVIVHTNAFQDFSFFGERASSIGKYGVQIFFVIAGFTVAANISSGMRLQHFFIRRSYRLFIPYFVSICLALLVGLSFHVGPSATYFINENYSGLLYDFLMHLSLMNIFVPEISGSILGVEWTISVEYFSYFIVFFLIRYSLLQKYSWWLIFIMATAVALVMKVVTEKIFGWSFSHVFLLSYIHYFILGALVFKLRKMGFVERRYDFWALLLFISVWVFQPGAAGILFGISTALLLVGANKGVVKRALELRVVKLVGSVSFSLYLYHVIVISLLEKQLLSMNVELHSFNFFLLTLFVTLMVSYLSYVFVEVPSNRYGKSLVKNLTKKDL